MLVPRWDGDADADWYPWIAERLSGRAAVEVAALAPTADRPAPAATVASLAATVGPPERLGGTVLVGHSVGCQAVVRYLLTLGRGVPRPPVLLVAGWWLLDDAGWPPFGAWLEPPPGLAELPRRASELRVLLSPDDGFTSDQDANGRRWREVGAEIVLTEPSGHFNRPREPEVLAHLEELLA